MRRVDNDQRAYNAGRKLTRAIKKAGVPITPKSYPYYYSDGSRILFDVSNTFYSTNDIYQQEQGHFPYIPCDLLHFLDLMDIALNYVQSYPHFIDVGCGIGDKLIVANWYCDIARVSGIEYNKHTFAVAEQIAKPIATDLVRGDAFQHDFGAYNLIYMYHPIANYTNMRALFLHIVRTMPENGIIVEALPSYIRPIMEDYDGEWPSKKLRSDSWLKNSLFSKLHDGQHFGLFRKTDGKLIGL